MRMEERPIIERRAGVSDGGILGRRREQRGSRALEEKREELYLWY